MKSSFLGRGWKFPVQVDPITGHFQTVQDDEDVRESIGIILQTAKGERVMRADFGCGIQAFVFADTSATNLRMMENSILEAIIRWEPRVENVSVQATLDPQEDGKVLFKVGYAIRTTNTVYNLVYPFYVNGGKN